MWFTVYLGGYGLYNEWFAWIFRSWSVRGKRGMDLLSHPSVPSTMNSQEFRTPHHFTTNRLPESIWYTDITRGNAWTCDMSLATMGSC